MSPRASLLVLAAAIACARCTSSAPQPAASSQQVPAVVALAQLQGAWKVLSSSSPPGRGHVFVALVGATLRIDGDRLTFHERDQLRTKIVGLPPRTGPQAIDLDQPDDAKGWSRIGVVALAGETLTMSLDFPQNPRPTGFAATADGPEVVTLQRLPAGS